MRRSSILAVLSVIVFGCPMACALPEARSETGAEITIKREWKGTFCGYAEPERLVISSEGLWRQVWEKVHSTRHPRPELPEVDFEKDTVLAAFMGQRRSGGYSTEITEITKTAEAVVVEIKEQGPDPESDRIMALTQPYHLVLIKRFSLPVRFESP